MSQPQRYLINVEQYHEMGAAGVFPEGARVGLIEGELLIEVSDSTLSFDRQRKMQLYARHGIGEYWILNVRDRQLEVHHTPVNGACAMVSFLQPGAPVSLQAFPELPFYWSGALA